MKKCKHFSMLLLGLLIVSLVTTSVGGAYASTASAATPASAQEISSDNGVIGGLLALGLFVALNKKGGSSKDSTSPSKGSVPVTTPSSSKPSTSTTKSPATTYPTTTSPTSPTSPTSTPTQPAKPTPAPKPAPVQTSGLTADEKKAVELMNADRRANGLPDLKVNLELTELAEKYAQDMINRNYFSHYNPEGQSPFDRMRGAGISYRYAGENIAINRSVQGAETAFMNSSGHRANILNRNYTEVGIGVRYDKNGSVYVVQEFIGR